MALLGDVLHAKLQESSSTLGTLHSIASALRSLDLCEHEFCLGFAKDSVFVVLDMFSKMAHLIAYT